MALRAVPDHPKFSKLKAYLGKGKGETLGYLETCWHFCGKFTPQGDIGKYSDEDIELWIEWAGEPGALIAALVKSGWIDTHPVHRLIVHDWHDHADKATKQQLGRTNRSFLSNCSHMCEHVPSIGTHDGAKGEVERTSVNMYAPAGAGAGAATGAGPSPVPARGVLDFPSKPNPTTDDAWAAPADPSIIFMEAYPKQTGIQLAIQTYQSVVKDSEHAEVMAGLERWKQSEAWGKDDGMYIPEAHKWLTDRRWKDHPKPRAQPKEERIIFMSDIPMRRDMR